jgi:hypothetical protein
MSKLQTLGKRLDNTLDFIKQNRPDLLNRFENNAIPLFIQLINSNISPDLEERIISGLNANLDLLDMELKNLFENK